MTGAGVMSVEQKRMEEAAKRAAQRALEQLRRSRPNIRAGAGQVSNRQDRLHNVAYTSTL